MHTRAVLNLPFASCATSVFFRMTLKFVVRNVSSRFLCDYAFTTILGTTRPNT